MHCGFKSCRFRHMIHGMTALVAEGETTRHDPVEGVKICARGTWMCLSRCGRWFGYGYVLNHETVTCKTCLRSVMDARLPVKKVAAGSKPVVGARGTNA